MQNEYFRMNDCGDVLEIVWDGNVWVAGDGLAQYADRTDAIRRKIVEYLRVGGDDVAADLDPAEYGEWIETDPTVIFSDGQHTMRDIDPEDPYVRWDGLWPLVTDLQSHTVVGVFDGPGAESEAGGACVLADWNKYDGRYTVHDGACDCLIPEDVARAHGLI